MAGDDDYCSCGGRPLAYLGYGCSGDHMKALAMNVRPYFMFAAILGTELALFFTIPDTEQNYVAEQLVWQGLLFMGLALLALCPFPQNVNAASFFLGMPIPVPGQQSGGDGKGAVVGGVVEAEYEYYSGEYEYYEEQEYVYEYEESNEYQYYYDDDEAGLAGAGGAVEEYKSSTAGARVLATPGYVLTTLSLVMGTVTGFVFMASTMEASRAGTMGALGYTGWYLGFLVVAVVAYRIRTKYRYSSIFEAVHDRYGTLASLFYALFVAYRLHQLIWQNLGVASSVYGLAGLYGETTSTVTAVTLPARLALRNTEHWIGVGVILGVPLLAATFGGRRWSMLSSAGLALALVAVLVVQDVNVCNGKPSCMDLMDSRAETSGDGLTVGLDLLILTAIQGLFAFPWADAVVMDHAFITSPTRTAISFVSGFVLAILAIAAYSAVGVWMFADDTVSGAAVLSTTYALFRFRVVTYAFHTYGQLIVSMTAITAALVSAGKFVALDLGGLLGENHTPISPLSKEALNDRRVRIARFAMVFYAAAGVVGIALKEAWWVKLNDTALTQTMALGLGVPIVFMELISGVRPLAFFLPAFFAAAIGILHAYDSEMFFENEILFGDDTRKVDLGIAVLAAGVSIPLFALGYLWRLSNSSNRGDTDEASKAPLVQDDDDAEYYDDDEEDDDGGEYEYYDDEEYEYYE